MRYLNYFFIVAVVFSQGCSVFNFSSKGSSDNNEKLKKDLNKLEDTLPPRKTYHHKEAEKEVLYLSKKIVESAEDMSSEYIVKDKLKYANNLLESLSRSLGNPSQAVEDSVKNIQKIIVELDEQNRRYRKENEEYIEKMEENSRLISRLQGIIEYNAQKEKTLLDRITFWFWVCVIISIAFAVFVPGGMLVVKRFWSKTMEMFTHTAKQSAHAIGEMSHALSDYMAEIDDKEREKLKKRLNKMKKGAPEYWEKVKSGENPLMLEIHNAPKSVKKKVLNG